MWKILQKASRGVRQKRWRSRTDQIRSKTCVNRRERERCPHLSIQYVRAKNGGTFGYKGTSACDYNQPKNFANHNKGKLEVSHTVKAIPGQWRCALRELA